MKEGQRRLIDRLATTTNPFTGENAVLWAISDSLKQGQRLVPAQCAFLRNHLPARVPRGVECFAFNSELEAELAKTIQKSWNYNSTAPVLGSQCLQDSGLPSVMRNFIATRGKDNQGAYIEYQDLWDLDPAQAYRERLASFRDLQ